ncbi:10909_t:CDS:2 [Acaulospora colombiana]|uniref:10909_t:CDS:1 n=1 Tax=Acaulospora colombiana TaxID=27376 RepID=A0ACA9MJ51_9GLOM|nr:10909_t:CDS:2 [Acaulospora colombiana]
MDGFSLEAVLDGKLRRYLRIRTILPSLNAYEHRQDLSVNSQGNAQPSPWTILNATQLFRTPEILFALTATPPPSPSPFDFALLCPSHDTSRDVLNYSIPCIFKTSWTGIIGNLHLQEKGSIRLIPSETVPKLLKSRGAAGKLNMTGALLLPSHYDVLKAGLVILIAHSA